VKKRTYVEFFYPGTFFDESSVREVASRNVKKLSVPERAFAFQFFDVMSTEEGGIEMKSKRLNISPMYYYGGRVMTLDEVRQEMPKAETLISNMQINRFKRVIKCRTGNFKPFGHRDRHIEV